MDIRVQVQLLPGNEDLSLPEYQTEGAAGVDLLAAVSSTQVIEPGQISLVPTGLAMAIPVGFEGQIRPRSGLALKYGISMVNTPGTIDSDYRGEIKIILINHGQEPFSINRGDRIAQMVFTPVLRARFEQVEQLNSTERDAGGFGSTGK